MGNINEKVKLLKLDSYSRHIFLCAGDKCCSKEQGELVWERLKQRLKELGVASPGGTGEIYRTKTTCLRVCEEGPIAVVYPEGVWYKQLDSQAIDRVIDEHLCQGKIVEDLLLAKNSQIQKGN